jgi:Rrf2 family protein
MQLPVKAHYATLAMLALAEKHAEHGVLPARVIARDQSIPAQFLGQILQQLRSAGLVGSTRGANGGFYLEQSPSDISVGSIVDAVCPASQTLSVTGNCPLDAVVRDVWEEVRSQQRELLERLTLSDLLARLPETCDTMFYI